MRRLLASFVVLFVAASSIVSAGGNHVKLLQSTVFPLRYDVGVGPHGEDGGGVRTHCSVFSVNPANHGWMTAAHCVVDRNGHPWAEQMFVGDHVATVIEVNTTTDLALVQTPDWRQPVGLQLAILAPSVGDTIETLGYAWGADMPFYAVGTVAQIESKAFTVAGISLAAIMTVGGMSGSPVIDSSGRVVGVAHIAVGGTVMTDADPVLGFTAFSVLKAFDRGWVFSH